MQKNKKIIFSLFIILLMLFCINYEVEATYSAGSKTVKSGESVSITIKSTEKLENFDIECTDVGGLTYKSCSSSITGALVNSSGKKISYALIGGEATTLGTYNFTAPQVTKKTEYTVKFDVNGETISSTITVKPNEEDSSTTDKNTTTNNSTTGNNVNMNNTTTNNTTNNNTNTGNNTNSGTSTDKPKEKSTNAYLSTLGITPKEYDFSGFKKTTTSYSVTIPYEVNSLKVLYKTADAGATVKVTGNSDFVVGSSNKIKVKVTAEDGKTTKTYTIKVTKLAEEEEKPGNVIENEEGLFLTSLELEGIDLVEKFSKDTYSYTAVLNKSDITEIEVKAVANKENANIEISGNKNLVVGENTINVVLKLEGSSIQAIYQIVVTKETTDTTLVTDEENDTNLIGDLIGDMSKYLILAALVIILMIVAVVVLICLLKKENRRLREEGTEETEDEYNVFNNDESEFEKNIETEEKVVEDISNEIETKNRGKRSRREKGKHSK